MAVRASALRRETSAKPLRCWLCITDIAAGRRVARSFRTVAATSTSIPNTAAAPIIGWNRKQITR